LEAELKVEKEWRATLQLTLDKEKMNAAKLLTDCHYLNQLRKVHFSKSSGDIRSGWLPAEKLAWELKNSQGEWLKNC